MARPTGWDILGLDGDPTPGVVESVQDLVKEFGDFAHDVEAAFRSLNSFGTDATALEWVGQTAEAFKGQFGPLPGRLQKLYISYSEASDALSAYVPKLQAAQSKADSALRQAQDAEVDLQRATTTANNAASDLKTAQQNHAANPNPQAVTDAQTTHDNAQTNLKNAQARMDALKAQAHQAHDDLDTAAKDCAKALHHAQHDGIHNKHWWQHVGAAMSEWGGKIAEVAGEIAPVLDVLAIATSWIPGVDVVTAGLAEADNMVALFGSGLQIAGDTMQGHYGDALMGAGMLGAGFLGGKALGAVGGKVLGKIGKEAEDGAEDTASAEARVAERDGGDIETEATHDGGEVETETAHDSGENLVGEDVRTAEGSQEADVDRDPVDVVSGWMLTDATDVELPGVLPLVLRRAYASGYATGRLFGPGWASTLDQRLSINSAGIHFAGDDTQRLDYPIPDDGQEVLPGRGARWPLAWDHESDEIRITDPWTGHTRHFATVHYGDGNGQIRDLTAITDRNGNRINIQRDEHGTPIAIKHPGYLITVDTAESSAGPRVTALRLMDGQAESGTTLKRFLYDARGRLTGVVNSSNQPFTYEWDGNSRISAWQDRSGYRYEYTYDHLGRVIRGDGAFLAGTFDYDPANRTTVLTDSLGHVTTIVYDEYGHVCSETDPLGAITLTVSDPYGRALSHTDALGHTTTYDRDKRGDISRVVTADGAVTAHEYNSFHQVTAVTYPDGTRWQRVHDRQGNLLTVTDAVGSITEYTYTPTGALASTTDPVGAVTRFVDSEAGLAVAIVSPDGGTTHLTRDRAGRVVRLTDPLSNVTAFEWNVEGLPVSRVDPDGAVTQWRHDSDGRLLEVVDPVGASMVFEPGPMDTLVAQTGADGVRHMFTYDSELNLRSVTNAAGAEWQYSYDPAGRLTGEIDFNGRRLGYEYDSANRLAVRTTGTGQRIALSRDAMGRVVDRLTPEGEYVYTYDAVGQLASATGPDSTLSYERDAVGRVVAETVDGRTTQYYYDAAGRVKGRTTASGTESAWSFDAAGRAVALNAGSTHLDLSFDAVGQEIQREFGSARLTRAYDPVGRLVTQHLITSRDAPGGEPSGPPGPETVLSRSWIWRADSVPEEIRDNVSATSRRISSDVAGRPVAITAQDWTETYAYDAFGNLAAETEAPSDSAVGKPTGATKTLLRRIGRIHNDYDEAGRLVRSVRRTLDGRRRTSTYTWDSQDRLVQADTPDHGTWRYTYDPFGRRTSKHRVADDGQISELTFFSWDGTRLAEESTPSSDGIVTTVTWDYDPGSHRPAVQRRRMWASDAKQDVIDESFHAIITDVVGAPTELVTPDGHVAWQLTTSAWGRTVAISAAPNVDCPLRFPGQYHDVETGLHYNLFRYYAPDLAAYLTPDPLGLAPAPNDHAYVPNPLTLTDPLGLAYEGNKAGDAAPQPVAGGGASLDNLSASDIRRIQNAADRTGVTISVVGSRAAGTARALSDWDYILSQANARVRHSLKSSLPAGPIEMGPQGRLDFLHGRLNTDLPYITFTPRG